MRHRRLFLAFSALALIFALLLYFRVIQTNSSIKDGMQFATAWGLTCLIIWTVLESLDFLSRSRTQNFRCPGCDHSLRGLKCPECGRRLDGETRESP